MNEERAPRLERLLEQSARALSGGGLHPVQVLERVQAAVQARIRDGTAPNVLRIALHPLDFARYEPALADLRREIEALLDRLEAREGLARIGDWLIEFERSDAAAPGVPAITASFADTANRTLAPPAGATQHIRRHRGLELRFADGTRVPLTHTPFRIGRGPGNDFVYPSLALSRLHAEIVATPEGLAIRDLGSRNGVFVEGERVDVAPLLPGRPVRLADLEFSLEELR